MSGDEFYRSSKIMAAKYMPILPPTLFSLLLCSNLPTWQQGK